MACIGIGLLLLLKSKIADDIVRQGSGLLTVEYGIGFALTGLCQLGAAIISVFELLGGGRSDPVETHVCNQCGTKNPLVNSVCNECGGGLDLKA